MSLIRVLRTAEATITHRFYVSDALTDATGDVAVSVTRLDGTPVAGVPTTATHMDVGVYSVVKPGFANLDTHLVTFSGTFGSSVSSLVDVVEICGGYYVGVPELRVKPYLMTDPQFTFDALAVLRTLAEQECDRICQRAFVPRYTRLLLNGTGTCVLPVPDSEITNIRSASTATRAGGTFTALGSTSLAAIAPGLGYLVRDDGAVWPEGHANVIVEYEYGLLFPPEEIRMAIKRRIRSLAKVDASTVPDRALSYTTSEGNVYRLTNPSGDKTGIPDVDAAYEGNGRLGAFA